MTEGAPRPSADRGLADDRRVLRAIAGHGAPGGCPIDGDDVQIAVARTVYTDAEAGFEQRYSERRDDIA